MENLPLHLHCPIAKYLGEGWRNALCSVFLVLLTYTVPLRGQNADSTRFEVYQKALDLRSNLRVMSVALQPGFEDFSTLAYFRTGAGAKVMSVFVTNGESVQSDLGPEYPQRIAAQRKEEAFRATQALQAEEYYLNFPDFGASRDTSEIRLFWPADTVRSRLLRLIADFQPDIILIPIDKKVGAKNSKWATVLFDVLESVDGSFQWKVKSILIEDSKGFSLEKRIQTKHPITQTPYQVAGMRAAAFYESLGIQRKMWVRENPRYVNLIAVPSGTKTKLDGNLWALKPSRRLESLNGRIQNLSSLVLQSLKKGPPSEKEKKKFILEIATLQSSVLSLMLQPTTSSPEKRLLTDWADALQKLRAALLGARVVFSISEKELVERQLTFLTIDTVYGMKGGGNAELTIHGVAQGWLVNEVLGNKLPLTLGARYRLLSPARTRYSLPAFSNGLLSPKFGTPFIFSVSYRTSDPTESFDISAGERIFFTPKFTLETFPPVIKVSEGEYVTIRLTNHSRDPVADAISISDSLAWSDTSKFRIARKDSVHADTLFLSWRSNIPEGRYDLALKIREARVGVVRAIQFPVAIDTTKRVAVLSPWSTGGIAESLRRLGLKARVLPVAGHAAVEDVDVVIVQRRALSFVEQDSSLVRSLTGFAENGGHVIILSQDAVVWNRFPVLKNLILAPSELGENMLVRRDSSHRLLQAPNKLSGDDWQGWIFYRAFNALKPAAGKSLEAPIRSASTGDPFVVIEQRGKGRITYVDLALDVQLLNIHPGAFRLLANLVSY